MSIRISGGGLNQIRKHSDMILYYVLSEGKRPNDPITRTLIAENTVWNGYRIRGKDRHHTLTDKSGNWVKQLMVKDVGQGEPDPTIIPRILSQYEW